MAAPINLKDTHTGQLVALREPGDELPVSIYACGPTVYDRVHVGNARPFIVFSLLRRFIAAQGYATRLVMNITDINDKIYGAAGRADTTSDELAQRMSAHYVEDTSRLGLGRPDAEPKATEHVADIVALIETLIAREHAYVSDGDVYFSVTSYAGYGVLSHRHTDEMSQGERADIFARKRNPMDFALWKATKEDEDTSWPSPWGAGRPGWHIECSAMAEALLGLGIDIHGGGANLLFPHHENEAAQTQAARSQPLARIWMHNGMLMMGEKMSKSEGNVVALHTALDEHGPTTLLMLFAGTHYSQPLAYSEQTLAQASARANNIAAGAAELSAAPLTDPKAEAYVAAFHAALANDFNTPQALAELAGWLKHARAERAGREQLRELLWLLGLEELAREAAVDADVHAQALELMAQRERVRAQAVEHARAKEREAAHQAFAAADILRDELAALGFAVKDSAAGSELTAL